MNNVVELAGDLRVKSFVLAWETARRLGLRSIVEAGSYRGVPSEGQSTVILSALAAELDATFDSVDLNPAHTAMAGTRLTEETAKTGKAHPARLHTKDSVAWLSRHQESIGFLYLDSYDYNPNEPLPAQLHQMAELGAAWGKLSNTAAVLMDDCRIRGGGKGHFTSMFLEERGFTRLCDDYQRLYVREFRT